MRFLLRFLFFGLHLNRKHGSGIGFSSFKSRKSIFEGKMLDLIFINLGKKHIFKRNYLISLGFTTTAKVKF
jgi:hypothetical protein